MNFKSILLLASMALILSACQSLVPSTSTDDVFSSGDSFNGKVYLTVTSPDTGRVWLDRNLGADQKCTSITDPDCYGYHYQWGRDDDGHELTSSTVTATLATVITPAINSFITNNTAPNDWTSADSSGSLREAAWANAGANDVCPVGFSVPTKAEIEADTTTATTVTVVDHVTAFTSFLKLPAAGWRHRFDGNVFSVGNNGFYSNRSLVGGDPIILNANSSGAQFVPAEKAYGVNVRCIKDL